MAAPIAAAGIAAGIQLAGAGINALATSKLNKATMEWNERMYGRQRQDAESDWLRQLEYNDPKNQMIRLRNAGLNPALVYGDGATTTATSPIRGASSGSWSPQTPDLSGIGRAGSDAVQAYMSARMFDEQLKTMEIQRQNMTLESLLKGVAIAGGELKNAKAGVDLDLKRDTYDAMVKKANEQVRAMEVGTDIKELEEVRKQVMFAPTFEKALESLAKSRTDNKIALQQLENLKRSGRLQETELKLRKLGLSFNDGVVLRVLAQFAKGDSLPEVIGNLWESFKGFGKTLGGRAKDVVEVK